METMKINGKEVEIKKGETILQCARREGFNIPTLCYHEALKPYGGCRLCVVEIKNGNSGKLVSSCMYKAEKGLSVETESKKVISARKLIIQLLLIDGKDVPVIKEIARKMGVKINSRFKTKNEPCILCGLCIRACREIVGVSAIDYAGRGYGKKVSTPYFKKSSSCIGCGTCFYICPTGAVKMHDIEEGKEAVIDKDYEIKGPARVIENWKTAFEMVKCKKCGRNIGPSAVIDFIKANVKTKKEVLEICFMCRE
ncbi:MAG: 4Fe-4S dicluster domain-containing protein [Candidatus Schekmanbacteria bacterium]|nr:MAG: 4Fe-4S dicluster domain-containing protein [Candidatus Schekmanbacteria bacterium]